MGPDVAPKSGPLVMVIDDDEDIRASLSGLLEDAGFRVVGFGDGKQGLAYLADGELPCLILLDLMMPVMDGWRFRVEQVMNPALASVPVIVITAGGTAARGADLGVEVVAKPFDAALLMAMVRRHCAPSP
jgi:CheY-like chemotaxis protein